MQRLAGAAFLLALAAKPAAQEPSPVAASFRPDLCAIELPCGDVVAATGFWRDAMGWSVERDTAPEFAVLVQGKMRLLLRHNRGEAAAPGMPSLSINVQVGDLSAAVAAVRAHGGAVAAPEPQPFALGMTVAATDPGGNAVHLLTLSDKPHPAGAGPRLFNLGWSGGPLAATESFWTALGLQVASSDFLPAALPMQRHGAAAIVFHPEVATTPLAKTTARPTLYFAVPALDPVAASWRDARLRLLTAYPTSTPLGRALRLRDPDGLAVAIVERSPARLWYERLLSLEGTWQAKSTKGWESATRFYAMARGTVLVEDDPQGDRANAMLSCIAMDGERLLLTHYCHAGNAPRLVADVAHATADTLTFLFLDGLELATRDVGHMDEAKFVLDGPDGFRVQWQWYQDGKQRPMEEIVYRRQPR